MLLLFLVISYLSRVTPQASSLLIRSMMTDVVSPSSSLPADSSCTCPDQRSVWDIVWSCFATIFACSWIAVHPDIPAPDETWAKATLRRIEYMFWTILTPELIIYWAARQWFGAYANASFGIAKEHGWTMTHGHFVQMGGFTLFNGGEPKGILSMDRLNDLAVQGRIEFPQISQRRIEDQSKSDGLSKILVVGQTSWFILQVLARRIRGLDITELEIATLGFATLNAVMYFFWWRKPFDVQTSLPVFILPTEESDAGSDFVIQVSIPCVDDDPVDKSEDFAKQYFVLTPARRFLKAILRFSAWPWLTVAFLARGLHSMTENYEESTRFDNVAGTTDAGPSEVPRFYASVTAPRNERIISAFIALTGAAFGAIHCAGWFFTFPTTVERHIWRVGSLIITGIPLAFLLMMIPTDGILKPHNIHFTKGIKGFIRTRIVSLMFRILFPIYGLARVALVVEALVSLRRLPTGSYAVVEWTTFVPHILYKGPKSGLGQ